MDFRPITAPEKESLLKALRGNAEREDAILMDRSTRFAGTAEDIPDEEVITAIKSCPTHY